MEWPRIPKRERHSGFGTKLNICVGCKGYITPGDHSHFCLLREIGHELDGTSFSNGDNQYHPECIKVGKPFKTRLVRATLGLQYPPAMTHFPFICEACAVLGRELTWTSIDMHLLMLQWMRLIDMEHAWASSVFQGTARYLGRISNFGQKYGMELFQKARSPIPPVGRHSFAVWHSGVHSPEVPKYGRRNQAHQHQKPPVSGLCLTPLGENAPISMSHVPG
jgi:hypothetical protein